MVQTTVHSEKKMQSVISMKGEPDFWNCSAGGVLICRGQNDVLSLYLLLVRVITYSNGTLAYEAKTMAVHAFRGFLRFYILSGINERAFLKTEKWLWSRICGRPILNHIRKLNSRIVRLKFTSFRNCNEAAGNWTKMCKSFILTLWGDTDKHNMDSNRAVSGTIWHLREEKNKMAAKILPKNPLPSPKPWKSNTEQKRQTNYKIT